MKYITIELTHSQIDSLIYNLQSMRDSFEHNKQEKAFYKRMITKLVKARTSAT